MTLTPSEPPITVLLADDQAMVRAGFRMIVDSQPDMTVIGEVDNGRAAVELAQRIRPDVCLLDIRMPVLDGLAATRLLAGPDVPHPLRVVIATTFDSDEHVQIALRNGALTWRTHVRGDLTSRQCSHPTGYACSSTERPEPNSGRRAWGHRSKAIRSPSPSMVSSTSQ